MSGGNSILLALPVLAVTVGLAAPIFMLDGSRHFTDFVWKNPWLVTPALAGWGVCFHWVTRRAAAIVLLRSAGAKLRVRDDERI